MGNVVSMTSTAKGFDESGHVLSGTYAACAATNGKSWVGRYIQKAGYSSSGDLTSAEASGLTENGLAILVVQHVRGGSYASDSAAASQGTTDGNAAVTYASSIGAPSGTFLYCDVESFDYYVHGAAWAKAWATAVNGSVYKAAYYGDPTTLGLITGVTWHGYWENVANMGSLPSANISQGAATTLSCNTNIGVDLDSMVTSLGGFWGY